MLNDISLFILLPDQGKLPFFSGHYPNAYRNFIIKFGEHTADETPLFPNGVFVSVGIKKRFDHFVSLVSN